MKQLVFMLMLGVFFFIACEKSGDVLTETSQLRVKFLESRDFKTMKSDYSALKVEVQKALWIEKLNQLKLLKLPEKHLVLIEELTYELENRKGEFSLNNNKIRNTALQLARITSEAAFQKMFFTLEDYKITNEFYSDDKCERCIESLQKTIFDDSLEEVIVAGRADDCNCRWWCDPIGEEPCDINVSSDCNQVKKGCGFLWLQNCTRRAELDC